MVYCSICEREFSEEHMRKVIFKEGIVNVCDNCYREDMPLFEKPDMEKLRGIYNRRSVYSRLSQSAGVKDVEEHKRRISEFGKESNLSKDESLRRIVNRNYAGGSVKVQKNEDLIDNFHWVIMRARRSKKISQKQLSEEIQEPESLIAMAERGVISSGNTTLVRKLEEFLRIKISKKPYDKEGDKFKRELLDKLGNGGVDSEITNNLTVEDVKDATKKRKWWQFGRKKKKEEEKEEPEIEEFEDEEEVEEKNL